MNWIVSPLRGLGRAFLDAIGEIGRMTTFATRGAFASLTPPFYPRALLAALARIGFASLPVVGLTAIFTGGALALNIYDGSARFNAESFLPQIVGVSLVRELGPVLAALMVAGRCTSAMAAEIGTMRVTEQIDAMTTLAVKPMNFLIGPRILATTIALPVLVLIADLIGVLGGWLVAVYILDFSGAVFIRNLVNFITVSDVMTGLIKAAVFGFLISVMGCYFGYQSRGGAGGVGSAVRTAVVAAAVLVLAANYVLTTIFVPV